MNVTFNIPYRTAYGDELLLNIAPAAAEGSAATDTDHYKALAMATHDGQTWSLETQLDESESKSY